MADKKVCEVNKTPYKCFFKNPVKALFYIVHNFYESVHSYITKHDIQAMHMFYILFWLTLSPLFIFYFNGLKDLLFVLAVLSPLWLTGALSIGIWHLWMDYIQLKFLADAKQEGQLYELIVPGDITKSPKAMELFLEGLLLTQGTTTEIDKYWKGRVRPWWSLEIAGVNGEVKMYMWFWKRFREHVESNLYGQYPQVQLVEVSDYAQSIKYDPDKHFAWGHRFKLSEDESLPIKTYVDYELDKDADKWETKIDPMVNMLEKFALMKEGEQLWLQVLCTKSERKIGDEAEETIKKIYEERTTQYPAMGNPDLMLDGAPNLRPSDKDKIDTIQRARKKPAFDCIVRNLYIADLDVMETLRIQSMGKMFAHYDGHNKLAAYDGAAPGGDYPWQDWTLPSTTKVLTGFMNAYGLRSGFYAPFKRPRITLTTEELATIFHFPSQEGKVPGLDKAGAKTAAPPTNLPI